MLLSWDSMACGGRKLITLQLLKDTHREFSTLRGNNENQQEERMRSRYMMPRGVEMLFTGGGESHRRNKLSTPRKERRGGYSNLTGAQ